jgi:AcrR family transcriptional regulator
MDSHVAGPKTDALCNALVRVVAERGWSGTTTARVARDAGLAPAEFYDHFRSLEACYLEVYDRMLARAVRTARRTLVVHTMALGTDAWQEQLDAIFRGMLLFFSLEPTLARTCLVEVLAVGPAARARREAALERFTSFVEGLRLTHGGPMPPLAAELIVLGTTELINTRVARGEAERLPALLPDLRRLWVTTVEHHAETRATALT